MQDANLEPEEVPEASTLTSEQLRARREASGQLTRRQVRERERRARLEMAFGATEPQPAVAETAENAVAQPAAANSAVNAPTSQAEQHTAPAQESKPQPEAASIPIRNHVSAQQRDTRDMPASGLASPIGGPRKVSAVRGNVARVLSAESLFDVDLRRITRPLQVPAEDHTNDTGPQPRVTPSSTSASDPELLRRARAHTLRGRRPVIEPEPTPQYRSRKRSGAVLRKVAASGILLVAGAFVVATTVPAANNTVNQGGTAPLAASDTQSLTVSASAVQAGLAVDGELGINDALASARLSEADIAEIQAIADADTPAQTYWTTVSGYEQALEHVATSYVQSPFPHMENVPITSPFEPRWGTFHEGLDFGPGAGTEIRPVANGIVSHVMQGEGAGGYMVTVDHIIDGKRVQTGYAHMEAGSIQVREGQVVTIDTVIGNVGSTGFSTGPHLHLEVRTAEVVLIDPYRWLHDRSEVSQANWTSIGSLTEE